MFLAVAVVVAEVPEVAPLLAAVAQLLPLVLLVPVVLPEVVEVVPLRAVVPLRLQQQTWNFWTCF